MTAKRQEAGNEPEHTAKTGEKDGARKGQVYRGRTAEDYPISLRITDLLLIGKCEYLKKNNGFLVEDEIRCAKNGRHLFVASTTHPPQK